MPPPTVSGTSPPPIHTTASILHPFGFTLHPSHFICQSKVSKYELEFDTEESLLVTYFFPLRTQSKGKRSSEFDLGKKSLIFFWIISKKLYTGFVWVECFRKGYFITDFSLLYIKYIYNFWIIINLSSKWYDCLLREKLSLE